MELGTDILRMTMGEDDNGSFLEDDNSMPDTKVQPFCSGNGRAPCYISWTN